MALVEGVGQPQHSHQSQKLSAPLALDSYKGGVTRFGQRSAMEAHQSGKAAHVFLAPAERRRQFRNHAFAALLVAAGAFAAANLVENGRRLEQLPFPRRRSEYPTMYETVIKRERKCRHQIGVPQIGIEERSPGAQLLQPGVLELDAAWQPGAPHL